MQSQRIKLPLQDASALQLDFGTASEQQGGALADLETQIEEFSGASGVGGEYIEWRDQRDLLRTNLKTIATDLLGEDHEIHAR